MRTPPLRTADSRETLSLTSLRVFISVAEELSLTRAARREHLVIAAVSKRVKELEATLGTQLLYRAPRGVSLTPAGHSLLVHARRVMQSLSVMRNELAEYAQGVSGYVRLHVTTASVTQYLPEELSAFLIDNPQVRIDLKDGSTPAIIRALLEGTADLGIVDGRATLQGMQTLPYRRHRLVVVTPASHPLARERCVSISQVADFDLIGTPDNSSLHALILREAAQAGVVLRLRMQLRGLDGICRMIQSHLGIGILPEPAIRDSVKAMGLRATPIAGDWAWRSSLICFRSMDGLSRAARCLALHLAAAETGSPEAGTRRQPSLGGRRPSSLVKDRLPRN